MHFLSSFISDLQNTTASDEEKKSGEENIIKKMEEGVEQESLCELA